MFLSSLYSGKCWNMEQFSEDKCRQQLNHFYPSDVVLNAYAHRRSDQRQTSPVIL